MKTVVMLPTYNEAEGIAALIQELLALPVPGLEVLVVDDRSPDGTGAIVANLCAREPRVSLLSRGGKAGRGLAGRDGFLRALDQNADAVVEMDADFSHQPRFIPELLKALKDCDIAVGSRMVPGGKDLDRGVARRYLTAAATAYARAMLRLPVRDVNSGFRAFSRKALLALEPRTLAAEGPAILHETLYRARRAGLRVREVPIEFVDRKAGQSKLDVRRLASGCWTVLKIAIMGG